MPRKSRLAVLAAAVLGIAAAPAHAAVTEEVASSWANVNICNAGQLGARAQLAGDGSEGVMRARFSAEWLSPDGWVPLAGEASSPWQEAGPAEFTWAQTGWTFNLSVSPGSSYQLRAVAELDNGSGETTTQTTGVCAVGG